MSLAGAFFYLFAGVLVASAVMVVVSRQPVHSVLFLITAFFNAAGLFILLGAEFLAMILVIVYVGAVAVLFLFVVMMLDVDFKALRSGVQEYLPIGLLIGLILIVEILLVVGAWTIGPEVANLRAAPVPPAAENIDNTRAIGRLLYTHYVYYFQASGLILLVAMIGAIVLTLRHKPGVKRQDVAVQNARTRAASVEVRKVKTGEGV